MTTINNGIPFVPENTIDPAAGLNLALNRIDLLLQVGVVSVGSNTPAASPAQGARYIVGTAPTGAWAGQANKLARWLDTAWTFAEARIVVNLADGEIWRRNNTGWSAVTGGGGGSASWGAISGTLADQADLSAALNARERTLVAGTNISIDRTNPDAPVISASGGGSSGMANPMTAAGDIIRGGASGAAERLPVGSTGQVLTVVGGVPAWAASGASSSVPPVVTESTTARALALADANAYIRFTNANASAVTIPPQSSAAWAANTEIHFRRAAAGNLTLTPGSGVTLNAPAGGTLVMTDRMSVTIKRVAENVWDVIGQTVAA